MKFDVEQFSAINAAVANLTRAYGEKPTVPQGALNKYAVQAGVRSMNVTVRDGKRILTINNGMIEIDVGHVPAQVEPTSPNSGAGDGSEIELRKVA